MTVDVPRQTGSKLEKQIRGAVFRYLDQSAKLGDEVSCGAVADRFGVSKTMGISLVRQWRTLRCRERATWGGHKNIKDAPDPLLEQAATRVLVRLESSASGYVRVGRLGPMLQKAAKLLMERGQIERFDSPLGWAYRLRGQP